MRAFLCLALLSAALGCTPREPPNWPSGGAPLAIGEARWERTNGDKVQIFADGKVLEDGDWVFSVDRVGRVVDEDFDPVALLQPDGKLVGVDDQYLGQIGVTNAAPPWSAEAWLAVMPDGGVVGFSADGDRAALGRWQGCHGPLLRTCTLVTHLLVLRHYHSSPPPGFRFGVGMGVWL